MRPTVQTTRSGWPANQKRPLVRSWKNCPVFDEADRERVRAYVLEMAGADPRIVAGAELGSFVDGHADGWSDLDLTFAVAAATPVINVLDDWTERLASELDALRLFDLPVGSRSTAYSSCRGRSKSTCQ
jgi:hypothetical protein